MYSGHIGITWFLGVGCTSRAHTQYKMKASKTNKNLEITWVICTRNFRSKRYSENFHEFLWCSAEICFRTATSPNLTSLKLEVLLGTKMK
jgi:hypothetical protein